MPLNGDQTRPVSAPSSKTTGTAGKRRALSASCGGSRAGAAEGLGASPGEPTNQGSDDLDDIRFLVASGCWRSPPCPKAFTVVASGAVLVCPLAFVGQG